jgi:tetratricopeptide (TPR) repeat protein
MTDSRMHSPCDQLPRKMSLRRLWPAVLLFVSGCASFTPVADLDGQTMSPAPSASKREIYQTVAAEIDLSLEQGHALLQKGDYYLALTSYRHAAFYNQSPELARKIQELETKIAKDSEQLVAQGRSRLPLDEVAALKLFNQAVRLNPDHRQARVARDRLLRTVPIKQELTAREAALRQAWENQPHRQESFASLAEQADVILAHNCDHPLARQVRQHIDRERSADSRLSLAKGRELLAAGQLQQAKVLIQRARTIDPDNREISALLQDIQKRQDLAYFLNLARYRLEIRDFDKAEEFAGKALALQADDQEVTALLKRIRLARLSHTLDQALHLFARKDYEKAVGHLQRIIEDGAKYEEWPESQKTIQSALAMKIPKMLEEGKKLFGENKLTEASRVLVCILELDPDNSVAATYLKKIQNRLQTIQSLQ